MYRRLPLRKSFVFNALLSFTVGWSGIAVVRADTIHLNQGGTVEGQIIEDTGDGVRIRTLVGVMVVPFESIDHIVKGPSVFDDYDARKRAAPETAAGQVELAQWCEQNGLKPERKLHFQRALEMDANCEPARLALGFVKVNGIWVDGKADKGPDPRRARSQPAKADNAPTEDQKLVAAAQSRWFHYIRVQSQAVNDSPGDKRSEDAKRRILDITDPLAILPLARVLGEGGTAVRELLVEALSRFPQDEATLNLAVMALADPAEHIRTMALSKLISRNDPRVAPQFRRALQSPDEELIRRGATALGVLKVREAVPDLIELLTARRLKAVQVNLRPTVYFSQMVQTFSPQYPVRVGGSTVVYTPVVGVQTAGTMMGVSDVDARVERRQVTVFRTEVLEALKAITDVNFGFDDAAWRRWYEEQKP